MAIGSSNFIQGYYKLKLLASRGVVMQAVRFEQQVNGSAATDVDLCVPAAGGSGQRGFLTARGVNTIKISV